MIRSFAAALSILITAPFFGQTQVQAQDLSLPLPRKPDCPSYSDSVDSVDKSGCTAIEKEKYARRERNTPDLEILSRYRHNNIKYLTYHHQGFPPICNDPADSKWSKPPCKESGVNLARTRRKIDGVANSKGIGRLVANIQYDHINNEKRKTSMFAGGEKIRWGDIAYHYVVDRFGNIVEGRSIKYKPASGTIYGRGGKDRRFMYNTGTAGHFTVVILGNYDYEKPTRAGVLGIVRVLSAGQRRFRIPTENIAAHGDHANSSCPGENLYVLKDKIKEMTIAYSVQSELRARRCDPGRLDGDFGNRSKRALNRLRLKYPSLDLTGADDETLFELLNNTEKRCI